MKYVRDSEAWQMRAIETKVIVYINMEGLPVCSTIYTALLNVSRRGSRTNLLAGGTSN